MTTTIQQKNDPSTLTDVDSLNHARIDPSHCLADGLFKPLQNGTRIETPLDVTYHFKNKYTFRWQHPTESLSIADQNLFLAILRIASFADNTTRVSTNHPEHAMLAARNALQMELDATQLDCLVIKATLRDLARRIGIQISGPALTRIEKGLERLGTVTLSISERGSDHTFWKARMFGIDKTEGTNRLIAINPWLSKALVGKPFTFIDIDEQRALRLDAAKRMHVWLSAWLRPNETGTNTLEKLAKHVWGGNASGDQHIYRMKTVKKALVEITQKTAWQCKVFTTEDSTSARIKRPKLTHHQSVNEAEFEQ